MAPGGAVHDDRFSQRDDEDLYRGLYLSGEESDWVKHYLRVADRVLFGPRAKPRVVVVDEEWHVPQRARITPKNRAA